jgi:hypothetical protein
MTITTHASELTLHEAEIYHTKTRDGHILTYPAAPRVADVLVDVNVDDVANIVFCFVLIWP